MKSAFKSLMVLVFGFLSFLYLLNFNFGVFEFLPDNLPVIGNVDEALAACILLNCLAYFGLDLRNLLGRREKGGKVIDV